MFRAARISDWRVIQLDQVHIQLLARVTLYRLYLGSWGCGKEIILTLRQLLYYAISMSNGGGFVFRTKRHKRGGNKGHNATDYQKVSRFLVPVQVDREWHQLLLRPRGGLEKGRDFFLQCAP